MAGCSVDQAALALGELVKLHAPRWGDASLLQLDWLHRHEQSAGTGNLLAMLFPGFLDRYEARMNHAHVALSRRLIEALPNLMAQRGGPLTVTHGDYRLDNMLFGTEAGAAPLAVVDWQTCTTGPALTDASYFIGAGLRPDDRRAHEEALMREYHRGLVASGVDLAWDTCWDDYRRYSFGGLVMAIAASMLVERTDRGDDMFMTMASRHSTQALDLGADAFLTG
jgi:aminoglycoside phosphotransferase (APT) family kinase protein